MVRTPLLTAAVTAGAVALGCLAAPAPAHAWVRWGVGIGVPVFPPAYYYPPPAYYYPPPPVTYVQPPATGYVQQPTVGQSCDAGDYACPTQRPLSVGSACSCPGERGRVAGTVR